MPWTTVWLLLNYPAFLKEVMTFPAIVVDDDPHLPVVAEI